MDRVDAGDQTLNQVLDANVTRWLHIWVTGPFVGLSESLRVQHFIFGALCPSRSGLVTKHIVKTQ